VEERVEKKDFDISVIRPEIRLTDLKQRGQGMPSDRLKSIKEGLQTLHTLETMAANIYKFQMVILDGGFQIRILFATAGHKSHS
jgi:hypothetical protein